MFRYRSWPLWMCAALAGCFNPPSIDSTEGSTMGTGDSATGTTMGPGSGGQTPLTTSVTTGLDSSTTNGPDPSSTGTPSTDSSTGGGEPEIEISIDGRLVESGATIDLVDTADVGLVGPAVSIVVENVGGGTLLVTGVLDLGPDSGDFVIDQAGLAPSLGPGESSEFTIALAPANGGIKGLTVNVGNDDADENPYELSFNAHSTPNAYDNIMPANSPTARFNSAMAATPDGRVLLFGGRNNAGVRLADTWLFDVADGNWTALNPPTEPSARDAHEMVYVGGDAVMLFGGNDTNGALNPGFDDTWIFNLATEQWSTVITPAPSPRFQHSLVSLGSTALLFGGRSNNSELGDTWLFNAIAGTWINLNPLGPVPAKYTAALAFDGNDTVTIYGGFISNSPQNETRNYTISTNTWGPPVPGFSPGARAVLEAEYLEAGQMIVFSGKLDSCCVNPVGGTFAFDPAGAGSWAELTPLGEPSPRYNYSMAAIPGTNKAIIFGGQTLNGGAGSALAETWEYVGPRP